MFNNKKRIICASIALILGTSTYHAQAALHVQNIDAATYQDKVGTITFDDWGFIGPNGRGAADFEPVNGFNANSVGQIQHVVTRDPDGLTPDAPATTVGDLYGFPTYGGGNMDATVSFYHWAYTTRGGSVFSNMLIDTDGDYFIAQEDMNFIPYDTYVHNGTLAPADPDYYVDGSYPTRIAFKPYALTNAKGWCGSILSTNPGALEPMAGQVQFDFAFDVYFQTSPGVFNYSSTEIVKNFQMRSYGTITVDIDNKPGIPSDPQYLNASAVVNNTNPDINNTLVNGAPTDPNYYNLVSFMGAGVLDNLGRCGIPNPAFIGGAGLSDINTPKYLGLIDSATDSAACSAAGGTWQAHAFSGYAYILRADGIRVIEAMDYASYPDLTNVPTVVGGVAYNNDENAVSQPVADITGTPDAFAFTDQSGVEANTLTTSDTLAITGLLRDTVITITGGEYSINSNGFTSARGVILNNDTVQVRTTSGDFNSTVDTTLTIGSVSDTFSVTARTVDTAPNAFTFTDQTIVDLSTVITSNSIAVSGIDASTSITITGGEYSINGTGYTSAEGTVNNGDTVTVRHTSSAAQNTSVDTTLNIGGVTDTFSSTTFDSTPNTFTFTDVTDAALSSTIESNSITVTGINVTADISITGGEYKINSGSYQSTPGTVANGQTVTVRITSSATGSTTTDATLTIGGVNDTYSVTTASDVDSDGIIDSLDNCTNIANADQLDTDGDLYGNACDADFNNDGIVNSLDTGSFKADFFTTGNVETDLNSDNIVNSLDLGLYKQRFTFAPGPSGLNP